MEVLDTEHYLIEVCGSILLLELLGIDNLLKQVATVGILHDQIKLLRLLDNLVHLNQTIMLYQLQNFDLSANSLHICLLADQLFLQYFDSHNLACRRMLCLLHLAECSLAQCFGQTILTYYLYFIIICVLVIHHYIY